MLTSPKLIAPFHSARCVRDLDFAVDRFLANGSPGAGA
jgi:hypothetical protein